MERYARSHLANQTVLDYLATHLAQNRGSTADLLADLAEIDERRLYRPAGYESMYEYCVGALHLSEDAAFKRIRAARAARRFPAIFPAVADGRLSLTAVVLLAPYLIEATADELLAAAVHQTRAEIERLLAARFPKADLPTLVQSIPSAVPVGQLSPGTVGTLDAQPVRGPVGALADQLSPGTVGMLEAQPVPWPAGAPADQLSPGTVVTPAALGTTLQAEPVEAQLSPEIVAGPRSRVQPLAPQRFGVQFTMSQSEYDDLCYAQALLGHQVPAGDVAPVFARALKALIPQLERQKFAATPKPRPGHRASRAETRHIPAEVKRAVWERDGGQCTFVSPTGHRCSARTRLEFDHVEAFARGGEATVSGIRLRCRPHNQFAAERTFGTEFMRNKRLAAAERRVAGTARVRAAAEGVGDSVSDGP